MAELHVIGALRNKRAELAGMLRQLEQQLVQQRANLAHLDATMRLFDPDIRPKDIRPKRPRVRNAWFRQGECSTPCSTCGRLCESGCARWRENVTPKTKIISRGRLTNRDRVRPWACKMAT